MEEEAGFPPSLPSASPQDPNPSRAVGGASVASSGD